jgi:hypothetical protein
MLCKLLEAKENDEFFTYPIFYNSLITICNLSVFDKTWFNEGVHVIGDMLWPDGQFYYVNEFNNKYYMLNYTYFVNCLGIVSSVSSFFSTYERTINVLPRHFVPQFLKVILRCTKAHTI